MESNKYIPAQLAAIESLKLQGVVDFNDLKILRFLDGVKFGFEYQKATNGMKETINSARYLGELIGWLQNMQEFDVPDKVKERAFLRLEQLKKIK